MLFLIEILQIKYASTWCFVTVKISNKCNKVIINNNNNFNQIYDFYLAMWCCHKADMSNQI